MARGFQGAVLKVLGAHDHTITVTDRTDVQTGYVHIGFTSPTLFDEFDPTPAAYVRLWMPDPTHPGREHQRGYTVIDADPATGQFAIEFVLHDTAGPASHWAAECAVGDPLVATVYAPTSFVVPENDPAGHLLIGDAASIPAINAILAAIPDDIAVRVVLEWDDPDQRDLAVTDHPAATLRWVQRDGTGGAVVAQLADPDWADWHDWSVWIGAERSTVRAAKAALRGTHGIPKARIKSQAYWMRGRSPGATRSG